MQTSTDHPLHKAAAAARLEEFKSKPFKFPSQERDEALQAAIEKLTAAVIASNENNAQLAKAVMLMTQQLRQDTQAVLRELATSRKPRRTTLDFKRSSDGKISGAVFDQ